MMTIFTNASTTFINETIARDFSINHTSVMLPSPESTTATVAWVATTCNGSSSNNSSNIQYAIQPGAITGANWSIPVGFYAASITIMSLELLLSVFANVLLITTICSSPSLKTPPNGHLVNICINNLLLSVSIMTSIVSMIASLISEEANEHLTPVLGKLQLFICATCMLQYWCTFAAIGCYRSKTVSKPAMSLRYRSRMIKRCILCCWAASLTLGVSLVATFSQRKSSMTFNPFRAKILASEMTNEEPQTMAQDAVLYIYLFAFTIGVVAIGNSYIKILRTLYISSPPCNNRVTPIQRTNSVCSEDELTSSNRGNYTPGERQWAQPPPFTISNGNLNLVTDNFVVHFQNRETEQTATITVDDVVSLENPIRVVKQDAIGTNSLRIDNSVANTDHLKMEDSNQHRPLRNTLSNISNYSNGSHQSRTNEPKIPDFTDITPGAELMRFQKMKNNSALRNQTMRKDRMSLGGATKNSLIMLVTFLVCTLPLFVCSVPGVLRPVQAADMAVTLLICKMLFYLNAPAYPIWYLFFSKRVRKCLQRLYENVLIKVHVRQ